jgi:pimeloyl-ACP methyl ester carboxylesterase
VPLFYFHGIPGSPLSESSAASVRPRHRASTAEWAHRLSLDAAVALGATRGPVGDRSCAAPVRIWHGEGDANVPMHHARYVADRLRDADLVILRNVGHLDTAARWREFLQWVAEQHN